jgi:hypothetical protein
VSPDGLQQRLCVGMYYFKCLGWIRHAVMHGLRGSWGCCWHSNSSSSCRWNHSHQQQPYQ